MTRHVRVKTKKLSTTASRQELLRRVFLTAAACVTGVVLAASILGGRSASAASSAATRPISHSVIEIRTCRTVIDGVRIRTPRLREMVDGCVQGLSGESDPVAAWRQYVRPGQKVLLKFSHIGGEYPPADPAMLKVLLDALQAAGCKLGDITVVDCPAAQMVEGLRRAPAGWSSKRIRVCDSSEQIRQYLDDIDVIVNIPTLSDHSLAGLSGALINVSLPLIRKPARYFDSRIHRAIVDIGSDAQLSAKTKLTIVNALWVLVDGAPVAKAENLVCSRSVWAATDMVAVDALALRWLERFRRLRGLGGLADSGRAARYVALAGRRGLGQADLRRIVKRKHEI